MNYVIHITPVAGILLYQLYPTKLKLPSSVVYKMSCIHNLGLILFSCWTFLSLSNIIYNNGVITQPNYYFKNHNFDKIIYLFYLSKYYEFIDTFLLYLNNKTPIFLQKYHHIGAVVCWHLCYYYKVDGIWIATLLNSFVHTIMYTYYLGCLVKFKPIKKIKKYITTLQLCQLIPQPLCLYLYKNETTINYNILLFFTIYTVCLVNLFFNFYKNNYLVKQNTHEQ